MQNQKTQEQTDTRPLFVEVATSCRDCDGDGLTRDQEGFWVCETCNGSGTIAAEPKSSSATAPLGHDSGYGSHAIDESELHVFPCPECKGRDLLREVCDCCEGRGWFDELS